MVPYVKCKTAATVDGGNHELPPPQANHGSRMVVMVRRSRMDSQGHLSWHPLLEQLKMIWQLHIFACIAIAAAAAVAPLSTAVVDGGVVAFEGRQQRS